MANPPPPPPSNAAKSQVEAFGDAFDAAVSRMDGNVYDGDGVPTKVEPSDSEQVYANDLELRGVYTGPYNQVSDAPPSVGHLTEVKLKTLETAPVPQPAISVSSETPSGSATSFSSLVKIFLLLAVIGTGVAFALKLGLI